MIKRTHRRAAVVAGVALSVGLAAPASAIFIGTSSGTGANVDPGAPSAIVNVANVTSDLAPALSPVDFLLNLGLGVAGNAPSLALNVAGAANQLVLNDVGAVHGVAAPYLGAGLALTGGVAGTGLTLTGGVAGGALGIAGGAVAGATSYLNTNSAPAIIAAAGGLF